MFCYGVDTINWLFLLLVCIDFNKMMYAYLYNFLFLVSRYKQFQKINFLNSFNNNWKTSEKKGIKIKMKNIYGVMILLF